MQERNSRRGVGRKLISADRTFERLINGQPIFGLKAPSSSSPVPFLLSAVQLFFAFYRRVLYIDRRSRRRVMTYEGIERGEMTTRAYAQLTRFWVNISVGIYTSKLDSRDSPWLMALLQALLTTCPPSPTLTTFGKPRVAGFRRSSCMILFIAFWKCEKNLFFYQRFLETQDYHELYPYAHQRIWLFKNNSSYVTNMR